MSSYTDQIQQGLDKIQGHFDDFKRRQNEQADEIMQLKQRGIPMDDGGPAIQQKKFLSVNGVEVKHYARDEKLSKGSPAEDWNLGAWVRDVVTGTKAASSTAVVPTGVSGSIIDRVRAKTVVVEAGAGTIVVDGNINAARVTGDATVIDHVEADPDVTESDITFAAVDLSPKTLICSVPLTLEVVQDSPNLDDLLNTALAGAFGAKVDTLAIAAILADAAVPTSSASQACGTWAGVLAAVAQQLTANQDIPAAHISAVADFTARAGQLASTAGSWLGKPPVLSNMAELFTTSLTTGTGISGDFAAGLAIALRQALTVEVVRFGKPGSGSHLLIAHMRAAPVVLQPGRLFVQKSSVI